MMQRRRALATILIGLLIAVVPLGQALPAPADDPVVNGEFELESPLGAALEGTPADECIGIGHQVLYGSDTIQGDLTGGPYDDPNASRSDPQSAANRTTSDPEGEAVFLSGYGHCVFGDDTGYDLCWCNPAALTSDEAIHWSGHDDDVVADVDGDGDREIQIPRDSKHHNLWQAWPSPHQAYSGNFDALEFRVEAGDIASNAKVIVSLSATPLQTQSPWVLIWFDCQLSFSASQFTPDPATGQVSVDPIDADFISRSADCKDAVAAWNDPATTDAERREILGRLRIRQLSFWGWENVGEDQDEAVLDGVSLPGTTLSAEEAAAGNVNPNPTDEGL